MIWALHAFKRASAIGVDRSKPLAIRLPDNDADGLSRTPRLAQRRAFVNLTTASVH
jgi:hypothetical protein